MDGLSEQPPVPSPARLRFTTIAHARHRVLSPLSEERIAWLLTTLDVSGLFANPRVVDIGCGKAELALRIADRFHGSATGVDPNAAFLMEARDRANALGLGERFHAIESTAAESKLPEGAFDLACCVGSTHAFGGFAKTVGALSRLAVTDGLLLIGDGFWRRRPDAEYLTFLGATESEFVTHEENQARLRSQGLSTLAAWESSLEEWDAYESLYAASMASYLDAHPGDPDCAAFRQRIDGWRTMYLARGRETLGFGFYLCRVPGSASNAPARRLSSSTS